MNSDYRATLNVNLNVEQLPELLPISDNFSAVLNSVLLQHFFIT